MFALLLETVWD